VATSLPSTPRWRISSYSQNNGTCVAVADLPDGRVALCNSNHPDGPVVLFSRSEMRAWIAGVKAGEFDDLA
jgi:hypothetical protein